MRRARGGRWPVVIVAGMLTLAACGGGATTGGSASNEGPAVPDSFSLGPAEQSTVTVAIPFPDYTMYMPYLVGKAMGYYESEGLSVKVITADDVNAAVVSGSADIAVNSTGEAIQAIGSGLAITILAGNFCRQVFNFAVQPQIDNVQDLEGKNVVLAGTPGDPTKFQRKKVLRQEGWNLDKVNVNLVYPGPDSASWREFFVTGKVALIPFYGDDRPALEQYGAKIIIEAIRTWANNVHIASPSWIAQNTNTAVRFLRATMKAVQYLMAPGLGEAPAHKDKILKILKSHNFDVSTLRKRDDPWVFDAMMRCKNLYFSKAAWQTTIETQHLKSVDFEKNVDLSVLHKAQELLDFDNSPPKRIRDIYPQ